MAKQKSNRPAQTSQVVGSVIIFLGPKGPDFELSGNDRRASQALKEQCGLTITSDDFPYDQLISALTFHATPPIITARAAGPDGFERIGEAIGDALVALANLGPNLSHCRIWSSNIELRLLPDRDELLHDQAMDKAQLPSRHNDSARFETAFADLRSSDAIKRMAAATELAYGDQAPTELFVTAFDELVSEAREPRELALFLTALGRSLSTVARANLASEGLIRSFAKHSDPRISFAARGVLSSPALVQLVEREPGDAAGVNALEVPAKGSVSLVPLLDDPASGNLNTNDLKPGGHDVSRKMGRPSQTMRRLDAEKLLSRVLPQFEKEIDLMHSPIIERIGELMKQLAGEAAQSYEENHKVAEALSRLARRYGVALQYEKEGIKYRVTIRCTNPRDRGLGNFAIRTVEGSIHLANSVTWPPLEASPSE